MLFCFLLYLASGGKNNANLAFLVSDFSPGIFTQGRVTVVTVAFVMGKPFSLQW